MQKGKLLIPNWVLPSFQHRCYGLCYKIMQLRLACMVPSTYCRVSLLLAPQSEWSAARAWLKWCLTRVPRAPSVCHAGSGGCTATGPLWAGRCQDSSAALWRVGEHREVTPTRPSCCGLTTPLLPAPVTQLCWAPAHTECVGVMFVSTGSPLSAKRCISRLRVAAMR